jgi:hypothetical protein
MKMERIIKSVVNMDDEWVNDLLDARSSFVQTGVDKSQAVRVLEALIERKGMSCRIYTENRSAAMGAALIPTGFTQLTAIVTAIGVGVHNVATYNPDYEIGKHPIENKLTVNYKK